MINTGKLAGKTIFITGASRGIGKAIALKAAADGANIVIAAKTTEPHPKLPGTIYTAAKEIEAAGGACLPCVVDIRNDSQVFDAVAAAVGKFGGIDILINNASAISLTGTIQTPMKRYDLMNGVNARGTYLCSQACIPHLQKSSNAHILNISPPLNMTPRWFKDHVAYTMAKYGMSMCALGMAEELKDDGIAVNCLWPKTGIITAAMEMLGGGDIASQCRKPDIMSDAAYAVISRDSRQATGNFYIDEQVLRQEGITQLQQYAVDPSASLIPDLFLEDSGPEDFRDHIAKPSAAGGAAAPAGAESAGGGGSGSDVNETFQKLKLMLNEELVQSMNAVYAFELTDKQEKWYLDLAAGSGSVGQSEPGTGSEVNVTLSMTAANFIKMFSGRLKPTTAFMTGQLKIKGDMGKALKLEKLMGKMQKAGGSSKL